MQAVILAAGKGLRLRPFTEHHPKPLIDIGGKPLLEHTLNSLPDEITEVIIVVGYLGDQIIKHFGESWNGKTVRYVTQHELLGTGDALLRAKDLLHTKFLAVNGDDLYTKTDLTNLLSNGNAMLVWQSTQTAKYGIAEDENNNFIGFNENSSLINCGAYCLDPKFFDYSLVKVETPSGAEFSLPHTLAREAESVPVKLFRATRWLPVGTPEQLQFANNYYLKKLG
ncbi:NTP transferase domain-containing protein [bacterium]|nr:MAG: NTP transferase domain-containing protein [bacterium]